MLSKHRFIWLTAVLIIFLIAAVSCGGQDTQPEAEEPVQEEQPAQVDEPAAEEAPAEEEMEAEPVTVTVWSWLLALPAKVDQMLLSFALMAAFSPSLRRDNYSH